MTEKYKETLFLIRESTGEGNYTNPENWSITEIYDYLERKEKQIKKLKSKYNAK